MKRTDIKRLSIKFKFTVLITLVIIVVMLLVAVISLKREQENIKTNIKFQGYALSKTLALSSLEPIIKGDFATLNNYVRNLATINLNDLIDISVDKSISLKQVQSSNLVNYVFLLDEDNNALVHSSPILENQIFDDIYSLKSQSINDPIVQLVKHKAYLIIHGSKKIKNLSELEGYDLYICNKRKSLSYIFPELFLRHFKISENIFNKIELVDLDEEILNKITSEKAVLGISLYNTDHLNIKGFKKIYPIKDIEIMDFSVPMISENYKYGIVRLGLSLNRMKTEIKKAQYYTITLTIIGILLGALGANIMAQKISKPLLSLLKVATKISRGELDNKVDISTGDEIELLANGINIMAGELLKIVSNINNSAMQLYTTSDIIFSTTKKSKNFIEDIREKINEINAGITLNTNSINKSVSTMDKLSASAKNVFLNSKTVKSFSLTARNIAYEGMKSVENVSEKMSDINKAFNNINGMVQILHNSITNIENITTTISRITKKTNTLAYNVNLASLKSEGKKEVITEISSQVRILSEDIESSTLNIVNIIEAVRLNMTKVLNAIKSGQVEVNEGSLSVKQASKSLFEIVNNVNNVKDMVSKITELSQSQSYNSENVTKDIHNISQITRKTAFEVSKILKTIEEQVNLIQITFEKANELYLLANKLKKEIVRFKI